MARPLVPALGALALVAAAVGGPGGTGLPSSADTAVVAVAAAAPLSADANCHASYKPCLPRVRDLDCPEIGHRVTVVDTDAYRLDADHDGTRCDRYPEPSGGR